MKHKFFHMMLWITLLGPMGCLKMGPDFQLPDTGIRMPKSYQHTPVEEEISPSKDMWWKVFNNPEIDQVVNQTLKNNPDIKKATAKILEIQSQVVRTRADRFPSLNLEGKIQRESRPIIGILPSGSFTAKTDTHTFSAPAAFELDLWGRLARAEEAARADLLQAEENCRTVIQTVVAEVVTLYLQMESYERRIQITQQSIESYRRSLTLVKSRYERGLSSVLDFKQASRTLAQAEAILPPLRQDLGVTQQKLAVVLGKYPKTRAPRMQPEDYYIQLSPVPPGLSSELLLVRPDIRAAEAGLRALNARVGVTKASRFPRINLTASFGYSSEELDRLFTPESELWSLAAGIAQPLFDAGKLKAGQRAAEAKYEQGVAEYAKTILTAFSEVERSLLTRKEQLDRRNRVLYFLKEARAVQKVAETRYERGLVDYLTVLESQQTRFQAEENLVLVDLAILTNRVSLHRALGTGWGEIEK